MSWTLLNAVWDDAEITDPNEAIVMLALADRVNDGRGDKSCWPSIADVARRARLSTRGVQKILARLVERRKLEIKKTVGGLGKTNEYAFTYPEPCSGITPNGVQGLTPNPERTLNGTTSNPERGDMKPCTACSGESEESERTKEPVRVNTVQGTGIKGGESVRKKDRVQEYEAVRVHLFALYSRPDREHLSYMEKTALLDLVQNREHIWDEIRMVEEFRQKSNPTYFPKTMGSLLEKWQMTIDRARAAETHSEDDPDAGARKARLKELAFEPKPEDVERCRRQREEHERKLRAGA